MAQLKDYQKPQAKQEEPVNYKRDASYIRKKPEEVAKPSYGYTPSSQTNPVGNKFQTSTANPGEPGYIPGQWRQNLPQMETKKTEELKELVKKYNPQVKGEDLDSHLHKSTELNGMFRKGTKRLHNYGYMGNLPAQVEKDKNSRDLKEKEEAVIQRLNYIKRDTIEPSNNTERAYERTSHPHNQSFSRPEISSSRNNQKPYTPTTTTYQSRATEDKKTERASYEPQGNLTSRGDYTNRSKSPIHRQSEMLSSSFVHLTSVNVNTQRTEEKPHQSYGNYTPLNKTSTSSNNLNKPSETMSSRPRESRTKPAETFEERYSKFQQQHKQKFGEDAQDMTASRVRPQIFQLLTNRLIGTYRRLRILITINPSVTTETVLVLITPSPSPTPRMIEEIKITTMALSRTTIPIEIPQTLIPII